MTEHYPWCAAAQNNARPRSMRLIGPKCECVQHRKGIEEWKAWLATDEGKVVIADAVRDTTQENDNG